MACENDVINLLCHPGQRVAIFSAAFGRTEYESLQCPQPRGVKEESKYRTTIGDIFVFIHIHPDHTYPHLISFVGIIDSSRRRKGGDGGGGALEIFVRTLDFVNDR